MEAQGAKPQEIYYQMSMDGLTATGCLEEGFMLLMQAEAKELLFRSRGAELHVAMVPDFWWRSRSCRGIPFLLTRLDELQGLANMAWAFATADQSDAILFVALARAVERCLVVFNAQGL